MTEIFFGSLILSLIHASIPNHWIPIVAISRAENLPARESAYITLFAGLAHTASTIGIGIIIGLLGYELSESYSNSISYVAPIILITLGIIYIFLNRGHSHAHIDVSKNLGKTSRFGLIASLSAAMFFSPCIEIEAYYFSAGLSGWMGILTVSIVYLVVTVGGMIILVQLGLKGASNINSELLTHHEKSITGGILIFLGIYALFFH